MHGFYWLGLLLPLFPNSANDCSRKITLNVSRSYSGIDAYDYEHMTVNHSAGEYVNEMASTNGIESFWSLLKRGFMGTYHQMSPEHLNKYVNEFSFRHDVLKNSCADILNKVFYNTNGIRVTYKDLKLCPIKQGK